jgi:hypothetical protein
MLLLSGPSPTATQSAKSLAAFIISLRNVVNGISAARSTAQSDSLLMKPLLSMGPAVFAAPADRDGLGASADVTRQLCRGPIHSTYIKFKRDSRFLLDPRKSVGVRLIAGDVMPATYRVLGSALNIAPMADHVQQKPPVLVCLDWPTLAL